MTVAIDTCVFEHMFNREKNPDGFITDLLLRLFGDLPVLLVDSTNKIGPEYSCRLIPRMMKASDEGPELLALRSWMREDIRKVVTVSKSDPLMLAIRKFVNNPAKHADRAIVYIALRSGNWAISNDGSDILRELGDLRRETKRLRAKGGDVVSARYAHDEIRRQT